MTISNQPEPNKQPEPTLEQRRIIYQARRGLKELDFYIDPYIKELYLTADPSEQATFAEMLTHEDPDLLDYFLPTKAVQKMQRYGIWLIKLKHGVIVKVKRNR